MNTLPQFIRRNTMLSLVLLTVSAVLLAVLVSTNFTESAHAINVISKDNTGEFQKVNSEGTQTNRYITNITNTLLYVLGFIAVIAIIIGGIQYTTANGDQSKVKQSKDIIMYAVIGLIVAIMAWAIVNFVVSRF